MCVTCCCTCRCICDISGAGVYLCVSGGCTLAHACTHNAELTPLWETVGPGQQDSRVTEPSGSLASAPAGSRMLLSADGSHVRTQSRLSGL